MRFEVPQGKETAPNANYLWINPFSTSLKEPEGENPGGRTALSRGTHL